MCFVSKTEFRVATVAASEWTWQNDSKTPNIQNQSCSWDTWRNNPSLNTHKLLRITSLRSHFVKKFPQWLSESAISSWPASSSCNSVCDFLRFSERLPAVLGKDDWTCWASAVDYTCRSREQLVTVINRDRNIIPVPSWPSIKIQHLVAALHSALLRRLLEEKWFPSPLWWISLPVLLLMADWEWWS